MFALTMVTTAMHAAATTTSHARTFITASPALRVGILSEKKASAWLISGGRRTNHVAMSITITRLTRGTDLRTMSVSAEPGRDRLEGRRSNQQKQRNEHARNW